MTIVDEFEGAAAMLILDRLASRADELTDHWRMAVAERMKVGDGGGFGERDRPDGTSRLVGWIVSAPRGDIELPHALAAVLGELVLLRREQGRILEEVLVELRLLQDLLFDAVVQEVEDDDAGCAAAAAAALQGDVARRMATVMTLVAGMYGDELEQERREERRKLDGFTRMVSHEMRTPIGAAFTAARMLEEIWDELPPEERDSMLEVVGRGLARAAHLIGSVTSLTLARDRGREVERRSLRAVVEDVMAEVGPQAREAGVRIEVADPLPNAVVDGHRTRLILLNLLTNAVTYVDESREDRWVRIHVRRDRQSYGWRVRVEDNGLGIDPAEQPRVFRRFYRAHGMGPGSGLGLVVAREAAEQLGSEIELESTPGKGSTFAFTVPDEDAKEPPEASPAGS